MGRRIRDLTLIFQLLTSAEPRCKHSNVIQKLCVLVGRPRKLTVGVMWWDEVVMPHPPIQRVLRTAVNALLDVGHEGIFFSQDMYSLQKLRAIYLSTTSRTSIATLGRSS